MMGFGTREQPQHQNLGAPSQGSSYNIEGKEIDVEFGKHILKVDQFKMIFHELFAGWREIEVEEDESMFGISKKSKLSKIGIDYNGRMMNEWGSSYLYSSCMPLISSASQTSKLDKWDIYYQWRAKLLTIRMNMLSQHHFPKLRCQQCEYVTEDSSNMREHFKVFDHWKYTKMINAYGLDVDRYPEIAVNLANMSTITKKGLEGFIAKQITENYVSTSSTVANQISAMNMGQRGIGDILLGRNRNMQY